MFAAVVTTIFIALAKTTIHPNAYLETVIVLAPAFAVYAAIIILTRTVGRDDLDKLRNGGVPVPQLIYKVIR